MDEEVLTLKKITIWFITCGVLFLGGCFNVDNTKKETKQPNQEDEQYISVQDYDGEGYTLRGGRDEAVDIAKQHKEEIVKAVEEFFLDNYKTEVKVNNFIGAKDAVSVTVESVNEPFFYSYAIVPVDFKSKTVATDRVFTLEGEVEQDIQTGLYAMAYEEEFSNLDRYLENMKSKYPVIGRLEVTYQNTNNIRGYATPFYFISSASYTLDELYDEYINEPSMSKSEVKKLFKRTPIDSKGINISINLFMEEENVEPNKEIFDKIIHDIESMKDLPKASYSIFLNDNLINAQTGSGKKDNTLSRKSPNKIIKK